MACVARDARARLLVVGQGLECHGGDEPAFGPRQVLVVQADEIRDVQSDGTVARAVTARGAGQPLRRGHLVRNLIDRCKLLAVEGLFFRKGLDVLAQLLGIAHSREHDGNARDTLHPSERPLARSHARTQRLQKVVLRVGELAQMATAQRLHHDDGNAVLVAVLDFPTRLLELPVEVVELDLAKLHVLAETFHKANERVPVPVDGKAEVPNLARLLLLEEVLDRMVLLLLQILLDVDLAYVVQQVEVDVVHLELLELLCEDLLVLAEVARIVRGKFRGDVEAVSVVALERLARHDFGITAMVAPRRVKVVDAVLDRIVEHCKRRRLVDFGAVPLEHRKAHRAKPEHGKLEALEIPVHHFRPLLARSACTRWRAPRTRGCRAARCIRRYR